MITDFFYREANRPSLKCGVCHVLDVLILTFLGLRLIFKVLKGETFCDTFKILICFI